MRNLIIQYYIDTKQYSHPNYNNLGPNDMERYSRYSFEKYAQKYGIDFLRITQSKLGYKHPTWERFDLWLDPIWFEKYDQIMYVDSDVIAMPHADNIFDAHTGLDSFKAARYTRYRSMALELQHAPERNPKGIFNLIPAEEIQKKRFQTGVFILTKKVVNHMLPWIKQYQEIDKKYDIDDGTFLNWALMSSGVPYEDILSVWNIKNNGQNIDFGIPKFLHCAGGKKYKKEYRLYKNLQEWFPAISPTNPAAVSNII